jgi:glutathione peroxidase
MGNSTKLMKGVAFALLLVVLVLINMTIVIAGQTKTPDGFTGNKTLHDFAVEDVFGDPFDLKTLEGKKVMVVNTASKCGLTPQYEDLEGLYREYADRGFVIIGFPANNFNNQEPGTNEEIIEFCQSNFGVTFPMMSKVSVRGEDMAPVYRWLTQKSENGKMDSEISWNFQKYLIDEQGRLVDVLTPRENPRSEKVINWLND